MSKDKIPFYRRTAWKRFCGTMAAFVVFVTTYALILPALTLEFESGDASGETAIIYEETAADTAGTTETSGEDAAEETAEEETAEADTVEDSAAEEETDSDSEPSVIEYTAQADSVIVSASAAEGALPEGAALCVSLIEDEDALEEAAAVLDDGEISYDGFACLEISFTDADGNEIEPESGSVEVQIELDADLLPEDADTDTLAVQHLDESGSQITAVTVADAAEDAEGTVEMTDDLLTAKFEVESFSTFTITWQTATSGGMGGSTTTTLKTLEATIVDTSGTELSLSSEPSYTISVTTSSSGTTTTDTAISTIVQEYPTVTTTDSVTYYYIGAYLDTSMETKVTYLRVVATPAASGGGSAVAAAEGEPGDGGNSGGGGGSEGGGGDSGDGSTSTSYTYTYYYSSDGEAYTEISDDTDIYFVYHTYPRYYHLDVRISGTINVTSTYTAGETDVTVTKTWEGDDESDRPDSITVYILDSDGNEIPASSVTGYTGESDSDGYIMATLSSSNDWSYTWTDIGLPAGTYSVSEVSVDGYTTSYSDDSFTVVEEGSDTEEKADGALTVTSLTSVTIVKNGTSYTVQMNETTSEDENNGSGDDDEEVVYEFQSVAGHGSDGAAPETTLLDLVTLEEGDTIVLVLSFTYTYTDSAGVEHTKTVTDYTYEVTVREENNECDGTAGTEQYGFDIVISAEDLLASYGEDVTGAIQITNTKNKTSIQIKKVDGDDETKTLSGASFVLYSETKDADENTTRVYYTDSGSTSDGEVTYSTGDDGILTFSDLPDGTYILCETEAPDGYYLLGSTITIVISDGVVTSVSGTTSASLTSGTDSDGNTIYIITVANTSGEELPQTGGPGTNLFTCSGMLLLVAAALMYGYRGRARRREVE